MPPKGYERTTRGDSEIVYEKAHRNGDVTRVELGPIPNSGGNYFGFIDDMGAREELGGFKSKQAAIDAAKAWMRDHPKGIQSGGGIGGTLPGNGEPNPFGI